MLNLNAGGSDICIAGCEARAMAAIAKWTAVY